MTSPRITMPRHDNYATNDSFPFKTMPLVPGTNLARGVWLQFHDELTRDVYVLSPEEAEALAVDLFRAAAASRAAFDAAHEE